MKNNFIDLLLSYKKECKDIFNSKNVDIEKITNIITNIHQIDFDNRKIFKELYEEIANNLFLKNITIPSLNTDIFNIVNSKEQQVTTEDDFDDTFKNFVKNFKADRKILRRFMIIKLSNNLKKNTKILLLHDIHSKNYVFSKLKDKFDEICFEYSINEFSSLLKEKMNEFNNTYICIFLLSPNTSSFDNIQKLVKEICSNFQEYSLITNIRYDDENAKPLYFENNNPEEINNEIKSLIGIELVNDEIDLNASKAIKRLFLKSVGCHTLEYRLLKGGFSGSKVLLIQPYKDRGKQYKNVIKINKINDGKIRDEIKNFYENVEGNDRDYTILHEEVDDTIAIKYPYASSDSQKESISFFDYYEKNNKEKCLGVIDELFNIRLFKEWSDKNRKKTTNSTLYHEYINEDKIFKAIKNINGTDDTALRQKYDKIINYEYLTFLKTCHGDLHTENFFIEENDKMKIYLIDFGHTKKNLHAIIDYTTLEASIKFRHIPQYIEPGKLLAIEQELLKPDSFDKSYKFLSITREDLIKPFTVINRIREKAVIFMFDKESKIDYFTSLFFITMRQIAYPNLYQLYAYNSAKLLADFTVNLIEQREAH